MKRMFYALAVVPLLACALFAQTTVYPLQNPKPQLFDNNGLPCSGCSLYSYTGGTTTPLATYTDSTGVTPNSNPVVLNSAGRPTNEVWLGAASYKFTLKDAAGNTLWTVDNIRAVPQIANTFSQLQTFSAGINSTTINSTTINSTTINSATTNVGSLGPFVYFAHYLDTGSGTNGSPYVHSDNTGGIQTRINNGAGTHVLLVPGAFTSATPATLRANGLSVQGIGSCFSSGAYAFNPPDNGARIIQTVAGNIFRLGTTSGEAAGAIQLQHFCLYGFGGRTYPSNFNTDAAISFDGNNDQPIVSDVKVTNFPIAIAMSASGMVSDSTLYDKVSLIGNGFGFYLGTTGTWYFGVIRYSSISDNDYQGAYLAGNSQENGPIITGNTFARNCRTADCVGRATPSDVMLGINYAKFAGNTMEDAGLCKGGVTGCGVSDTSYAANYLWVLGAYVDVTNNTFRRASSTATTISAIVVGSSNVHIHGNSYINFPSASTKSITILNTATDTVIEEPSLTYSDIADSGVRTVFNHHAFNVGDPDAAGSWNGHNKGGLFVSDTTNNHTWYYFDNAGSRIQVDNLGKSFTGGISIAGGATIGGGASVTGGTSTDKLTVGAGQQITNILYAQPTLTFTAIAANTCQEQEFTLTNAGATGLYACWASPTADIGANLSNSGCRIRVGNTARVKVCNPTVGSLTPTAVTWNVWLAQ